MSNLCRLSCLLVVFVFGPTIGHAIEWQVLSGKLTYHVRFPLKSIDGVSTKVRGKGQCVNSKCEFLVAVPVKTFESGDGNRDNHMLEVTRAAVYPMVAVRVVFAESENKEAILGVAEVQFAGQKHTYHDLKIQITRADGRTKTFGRVPLKLSDFGVERPSLLTVKIEDEAPVDFDLTWQ